MKFIVCIKTARYNFMKSSRWISLFFGLALVLSNPCYVRSQTADPRYPRCPDWFGPESRATVTRIERRAGVFNLAQYLCVSSQGPEYATAFTGGDVDAFSQLDMLRRRLVADEAARLLASDFAGGANATMVPRNPTRPRILNDRERAIWRAIYVRASTSGPAGGWGDPHLVSIDGYRYDFQGAGEYVAARGLQGFEVQFRLVPWGDSKKASLISTVAFMVGSDRVTVGREGKFTLRVNGTITAEQDGVFRLRGGGIVARRESSVFVFWPSGGDARIIANSLGHLEVWIRVSDEAKAKLAGLLGDFDGDPLNDKRLPNGEVIELPDQRSSEYIGVLYRKFGDAWKVTDKTSLFDYEPGKSSADYDIPDFPAAVASLDSLEESARARAIQVCRAAGLGESSAFQDCVLDVAVTGDSRFASGAAMAAVALKDREQWLAAAALEDRQKAFAPSFNCERAKIPAEHAICENASLASKDVEMDALYRNLVQTSDSSTGANWKSQQLRWLKARNTCMADVNCLIAEYDRRINELQTAVR
jgi:von Willebrand factor type D domain